MHQIVALAGTPEEGTERFNSMVYAAIEQFNARLIDDPCYATLLGAFGTSMLYQTGSRPLNG